MTDRIYHHTRNKRSRYDDIIDQALSQQVHCAKCGKIPDLVLCVPDMWGSAYDGEQVCNTCYNLIERSIRCCSVCKGKTEDGYDLSYYVPEEWGTPYSNQCVCKECYINLYWKNLNKRYNGRPRCGVCNMNLDSDNHFPTDVCSNMPVVEWEDHYHLPSTNRARRYPICIECANDYCLCQRCGGRYIVYAPRYGAPVHIENFYCSDCAADHAIIHCNRCGDHHIHRYAFSGGPYRFEMTAEAVCQQCYDDYKNSDDIIHTSSYVIEYRNFGEGPQLLGIEIEADGYKGKKFIQTIARNIIEMGNGLVFIKTDESLSSKGFEVITHPFNPFTKREWVMDRIGKIVKYLHDDAGFDMNHQDAGIHIHINKGWFNGNSVSRMETFFINPVNRDYIVQVSKRHPDFLDIWAALKRRKESRNKYVAFNIDASPYTHEVRIFASYLDVKVINQYIDWLIDLIEYVHGDGPLTHTAFEAWRKERNQPCA